MKMYLIENCLSMSKLLFNVTGSSFDVYNILYYDNKFVFFNDAHHLSFNNFTFIIHNKLLNFRL